MEPDKRTKESPYKSEEKFWQLSKDAPIAIFEVSLEGSKLRNANSMVSRILGFSEAELLTMNLLDEIMVGESKKKFRDGFKKAVVEGKNLKSEIEIRTKSGQTLWALFNAKVIFRNNQPDSLLVFAQDITEIKKMGEALRLSEEKFSKAFRFSPNAVSLTRSRDGKIIDANESAFNILGYTPEEAIGRNSLEVWADSSNRASLINELNSNGFVCNRDFVFKRKDGTKITVSLSASTIKIQNEDYLLASFIDVTERKKAEESIKESEELYRTLFEKTDDGFVLIDPVYNQSGKVYDFKWLKISPSYERQTGEFFKKNLGKMASESVSDLSPELFSLIGRVTKGGEWVRYENFDRHSGKWYDAQIFPFAGKVGGLFRDVTERKKVEEALRESENKYQQMVDKLPEMVFEINDKGIIVFANSKSIEQTGYSREEFESGFDANHTSC